MKKILFPLILFFLLFLIGKDSAYAQTEYKITGYIYEDSNGNGVKESDETALAKVPIDIGKNGFITTQNSNERGKFIYTTYIPRLYTVSYSPDPLKTRTYSTTILIQKDIQSARVNFGIPPNIASRRINLLQQSGGGCSEWGAGQDGVNACSGWCQQNGGGFCTPDDNCATCHNAPSGQCQSDSSCSSGDACFNCPGIYDNPFCAGPQVNGIACCRNSQCASGLCSGGVCASQNQCNPNTCSECNQTECQASSTCWWQGSSCARKIALNQFCVSDVSCESGNCPHQQGAPTGICCLSGQSNVNGQCTSGGGGAVSIQTNPTTPPQGTVGQAYGPLSIALLEGNVNSTGDKITTVVSSGSLPQGLTLHINNQNITVIDGTPSQSGIAVFWLHVCKVGTSTCADGNYSINIASSNSTCGQTEGSTCCTAGNPCGNLMICSSNHCCAQGKTWNAQQNSCVAGTGATQVPSITVSYVTNGQQVTGTINVNLRADATPSRLKEVKACIDNKNASNCTSASNAQVQGQQVVNLVFNWDSREVSNGQHSLIFVATNTEDRVGEKSVNVNVQNALGGNPTTTPSQKYACNANGQCVQDANGNFTSSNCNNSCLAGQKYTCSGGQCVPSASGQFSTSNCDNTCGGGGNPTATPVPTSQQKYACNANGQCVQDVNGNFQANNCNNACTQGQKYTCSNNQCVPSANGQFTTSTCDNTCAAPTSTPQPTAVPTSTPIPTQPNSTPIPTQPNATSTPVPTTSPSPTVTQAPEAINLGVKVTLLGIGNKVGDNPTPRRKTRDIQVIIVPATGEAKKFDGTVTFQSNNLYTGTVQVTSLPAGNYTIKVKMDTTLAKKVPGTQTLTPGTSRDLPQLDLLSGDIDGNNRLDLADFNILRNCFGTRPCGQKDASDLNDDSFIEEKDLNILIRGIAIQTDGD